MDIKELSARRIPPANAVTHIDHAYNPSPDLCAGAHIYVSYLPECLTTSFWALILIAPDDRTFEVHSGDTVTECRAVAIAPQTQCAIQHGSYPLVSVCLEPVHQHFRAFRALPSPGIVPLNRASFSALNGELRVAARGDLLLDDVAPLIDRVLAVVEPHLPKCEPQDVRVRNMCEVLRQQPHTSLHEVAATFGISYHRASYLFAQSVGIPFRSYRLWCKIMFANWLLWSGKSSMEAAHAAGFADLAHLCRTYQKVFGQPPVDFMRRHVRIHTWQTPEANEFGHLLTESGDLKESAVIAKQTPVKRQASLDYL